MIGFLDREQRYRFVNRALADWFERPRKEILGRTMREVLGEEIYAVRQPMIDAALAGERQWFAADFDHPTRGLLAVQADYVPQSMASGEVVGHDPAGQDITEQRAAERALKESEARFRRIADSAPVMMWVTRLDRTRDFVNDAYVEFAGHVARGGAAARLAERIHPDDQERLVAESIAGEASLKPFTLEARYLRHDGEWRWLRSRVAAAVRRRTGRCPASSASRPTSREAKEAELELQRQVTSGPPS